MAPSRRSSRWGRVALWSSGAIAGVWVASAIAVLIAGARDRARPADAIVVLGAAQYVGRPSPVLKARLDHAVALWQKGLAPFLVLTGGTGAGDTISEAAVGRKYVMQHGVPDSVILLEHEGRTTRESLAAVAGLMHARQMDRAVLVSDPFHMLRLNILSRSYDITPYTSPTQTSPISASASESLGYVLSESVKVPMTLLLAPFSR